VFDDKAECPEFIAFLRRIFNNDEATLSYVQTLCGMFLTGDVREQILPVWYGEGANGKNTLFSVILDLLGPDYATTAARHLLMKERKEDDHELATLFRKRLVVTAET
jgi:putative DNA primase/helicase